MKILGIMGSPRRRGNSAILMDRALAGAESAGIEVEKLVVTDSEVSPCLACGGCERTGMCVLHDAMTEQVFPKLASADGFIVTSPVFFMGMPAQLKALVDRCQPFWVRKYLLHTPVYTPSEPTRATEKRKGLLIAVGATKLPHTFTAIRLEAQTFLHCLDTEYTAELCFPAVEEHGEIAHNSEALSQSYQAGQDLAKSMMGTG